MPAMLAGVRPYINQPIGAAHHVQVMLDHKKRVARRLELIQRLQQGFAVGRMQSGGRFVQHVHHAEQVGADLRRQAQALQLAR